MAIESTTTYTYRCDRCHATEDGEPMPSGWNWMAYERSRVVYTERPGVNWLLVCPDCCSEWRDWWSVPALQRSKGGNH